MAARDPGSGTGPAMTENRSNAVDENNSRQEDVDRTRQWTVLEVLRVTTEFFAERGIASARLDAECLLAHALGCERLALYVDFEKPVFEKERDCFRELVRKRAIDRMPVALLLGKKEFWSLSFEVNSHVLTPRPETETLVECAIGHLRDPGTSYRVLDLGTGSGCVALSIASERPGTKVVATDISKAALDVAARNAKSLGLEERVTFLEGDLFDTVPGALFDLVVSNPPYIGRSEADSLEPELEHEPKEALFGGNDGLDVIRALVAGVSEHLVSGGRVAIEIDPRQEAATRELFQRAGLSNFETLRDLSKRSRVATGTRA